ncbi:MAG: hypothetical protein MOGMAGMI_02335 [Candidatus Omnitrophica bacterium]|nr:hypothetical protein [Candidatus Omnitrophota bacterium]
MKTASLAKAKDVEPVSCPNAACGSREVRYRIRIKKFLCRKCGHEWERRKK